jgi:indolepyruvate ferredoxin oxidoreductase, beta subunit
MKQRIAISGIDGQDVHFLTRLLTEAALVQGEEVLVSEVHGTAMRGGSVLSHLKVGGFRSPLLRSGDADILFILDQRNLGIHSPLLKEGGIAFVNTSIPGAYRSVPASAIAARAGTSQAGGLVLLGYALSTGSLFCSAASIRRSLERISPMGQIDTNLKALEKGIDLELSRALPGLRALQVSAYTAPPAL